MNIATIDLETYWAVDHSLTKMSPIKYCMHPDTEIISCGFKFNEGETEIIFGEENVLEYASKVDWSKYLVVAHNNSGFDSMILAWRMGVKPALWGCTAAMARPIHAKTTGVSLAKLVRYYGLGYKDNSALVATKGRHLKDFEPDEIEAMREYNKADVDQCYGLLKKLIPQTKKDEMLLIDITIRMLVEPQFDCNTSLLYKTLVDEGERRKELLVEASKTMGVYQYDVDADGNVAAVLKLLSSAPKFAAFLKENGVEVPMKVSPTTGKEIPALAKTDADFIALQEHENEMIATVAAARLEAKSTILQSRINSFLDAAQSHPKKKVPIPLKYYGADTTGRWSGWGGYNPQNLTRINPYEPKPSDALRKSLVAPPGYKVVVADLSGIELRVNHFLWKTSAVALFQADPAKADLYKDFAAKMYHQQMEEVTKVQRQVGKVAHLGLGFGAGAKTFQTVAKIMGGVTLDEAESDNVVRTWRMEYPEICDGWRTCHNALPGIIRGDVQLPLDPWGMITPTREGLVTPRGVIRYPKLRTERNQETGRSEFVYGEGRNKARIYAGKIDENIVQHLARCVLADQVLQVKRETGLIPALMVHDELVYVVPEDDAEETLARVQKIMRSPVEWWPSLVTWSEGDIADTYGDAK